MIFTTIHGDGWGVDKNIFPGENGPVHSGVKINIKSGDQIYHIPFDGDSVIALIADIAKNGGLTNEQKRELAPLFTNGIFLPGEDFQQGPQG